MPDTNPGLQLCPTRIDRAPVLFAHKVTQSQCQDRQRGQYHKCFTCAYNNPYVQLHGKPGAGALVASKPPNIQVG
ncbi:MAG: hypothetical protein SGI72_11665 [Planctomycetota bacterium]|nr:hypothetical protein [Planctomycetota bacterium]